MLRKKNQPTDPPDFLPKRAAQHIFESRNCWHQSDFPDLAMIILTPMILPREVVDKYLSRFSKNWVSGTDFFGLKLGSPEQIFAKFVSQEQ